MCPYLYLFLYSPEEVRSEEDAHQGINDSVIEQQRTDATSSRSLIPKVKTRIEYKQKGTMAGSSCDKSCRKGKWNQ